MRYTLYTLITEQGHTTGLTWDEASERADVEDDHGRRWQIVPDSYAHHFGPLS